MTHINAKFSIIALALSIGFVANVDAAPSVRVLGSAKPSSVGSSAGTMGNTTGIKATGVNTGDNIKPSVLGTTAGAKKSASMKKVSPTTAAMQPVARAASNRTGTSATTATAKTSSARFPGIASKSNIQKSLQVATSGGSGGASGYDLQEMANQLANKVDTSTLEENYYTKTQIDEANAGYYTSAQVDEIISGIDTSASSAYIRYLTNTVNQHTEQIQGILTDQQSIYDLNSGETKSVFFVTGFDADAVLGPENDSNNDDDNEG